MNPHIPSSKTEIDTPPRYLGVLIFYGIYISNGFLSRVMLSIKAAPDLSFDSSFLAAYAVGFFFDFIAASLMAIPWVLYLSILPQRCFQSAFNRYLVYTLSFISIYIFVFSAVAELVFWDEFGVRFNFIAVDYLVYTTEVIRNIRESYNMLLIYSGVFAASLLLFLILLKTGLVTSFLKSRSSL
jgi:hypothetical protein